MQLYSIKSIYSWFYVSSLSLIGNVAGGVGGALEDLFFGAKRNQKLTIDVFRDFHNRLNTEILKMEVLVAELCFWFFSYMFLYVYFQKKNWEIM